MERVTGLDELLDGPLDEDLLAGNLRDLARVNRWLGGTDLSWRAISHVWRGTPEGGPLRLADIGTGGADIPRELLRRAQRAGMPLEIEASDVRPEIVSAARRAAGHIPGLTIVLRDGAASAAAPVDIAHASLVLHHLEEPDATTLLGDMARIAGRAVIVNDLARGRRWWLASMALARISTRNAYTRHDGPRSVLRAYQADEIVALAERSGLREAARFRGPLGHRYALVLTHDR